MKQETINLIKSMTEQGFLVIVDPGKENELRVAEAQAKKMLVQAEAEKQANELKQRSLTLLLVTMLKKTAEKKGISQRLQT